MSRDLVQRRPLKRTTVNSGHRRGTLTVLGAALSALFVCLGTVGIVILFTPSFKHLWEYQNLSDAIVAPGTHGHPLGTDEFGRDLLWRLIAGTGVSLLVSVGVTSFTIPCGLLFGSIAGYLGGRWDRRVTGLTDVIWSFPLMLVAVITTAAIGQGLVAVAVAVAAVTWAGFARIVRAQVLVLRERDFVQAARMLGTQEWKIVTDHIIPNLAGTVLVMTSYYASVTILTEAAFSFIGFGAQPPTPSLGAMLADGRNYWSVSPWPEIVPGIAIAAIVIGLNALGDGLRDIRANQDRDHPGRASAVSARP